MFAQTSSSITTLEPNWLVADRISAKRAIWNYGYVVNGQPVSSTPEQLIHLIEHGTVIDLVWTPDTPEPVVPEKVPFLVNAFCKSVRREARDTILVGLGFVFIAFLFVMIIDEPSLLYRSFWFLFGAMFLTEGIWDYVRSRKYTQEDAMSDAGATRFAAELNKKQLGVYSLALAACIIIIGVVQFMSRNAVEAAGLVKPAVWDGEIWRLFTATLLHADFTHFWMNLLGLFHLSKIVERTLHRAWVPLIFLLTGALGSVFSVLLYPNTTSVGASGGLMGLLGFITVAAYFDKGQYPTRYFRRLIEAIILVGALGLFGFWIIDNAAHFGGLAGGLLLGWLFLRKNEPRSEGQKDLLNGAGIAAIGALGLITVFGVLRMIN